MQKPHLVRAALALIIAGGVGLAFLIAVDMKVKTETSRFTSVTILPNGNFSVSNSHITEGDDVRVFILGRSGQMHLEIIQPNGGTLFETTFENRGSYGQKAQASGNHTLVITNMGSSDARMYGTFGVPLDSWLNLDLFNNVAFIVGAVPFGVFGIAIYYERQRGQKVRRYIVLVAIFAILVLGSRLVYWEFATPSVDPWNYILYFAATVVVVKMLRQKEVGKIKVNATDSAGNMMQGYWVALWQKNRQTQSNFSPAEFTVEKGRTYQVSVAGYGNNVFDHWSDGSNEMYHDAAVGDILTAIFRSKNG